MIGHEQLAGRAAELAVLDRMLDGARVGRSATLVVRGEAGIGKSALLGAAAAAASDMHVLTVTGVETESELPYAALHMLLKDVTCSADALPDGQADALRVALGLAAGPVPDRFLVGLAVLSLLAELATQRPVVCVLDDAHWFDRASADALLFAARRLDAESVVLLFAARSDHAPAFPAPGVAELMLSRLDDAAAREVLAVVGADLPPHVQERLLREADGNPLALRELPAAHRAGRAPVYPLGPPDAGRGGTVPTHAPVEREFVARIAALSETTRTLLLVAAADGTCDTGVVLAAAERLGAGAADLETAEQARLLMFSEGCLGFVHPLVRTAAYGSATLVRKRAAHRALADVLADRPEPDRRNWHRAAASIGPDEEVAAALEESALRARERGSHEAMAAAYDRAAALSPSAPQRARRLLRAAEAATEAGHREWAEALAHRASQHPADAEQRARLALVRARLAQEAGRPEETHQLLLDAVGPAAAVAPELAAEMLTWAVEAGWSALDRALVERAMATAEELGLADEALRAHATLVVAQLAEDPDSVLPRAVVTLSQIPDCRGPGDPKITANLAGWHLVVGDDEMAHELASSAEREGRTTGALGALPKALAVLAATHFHRGRWTCAAAAADEGLRIAKEIRQGHAVTELAGVLARLSAVRGDETGSARALAELDRAGRRGDATAVAASARALLDLGAGRFEAAAERLATAPACPTMRRSLPDLVEAAVRADRIDEARQVADRFDRWAEHTGQPWARAVALRCRALVAGDIALFTEAMALHRLDGSHPFERARTEMLHGEWLRRARRRSAARAPLRAAAETFEELGAQPWAQRARAELRATGETRSAPGPDPDVLAELTPQERQVVRLAAAGLSNRDIAAQLFLSPRTVGYHLYKAFPKLGVASRAQLVRLDLPA